MTAAAAILIAGLSVCPAVVVNDAPGHSFAFQTCYTVGTKASSSLAPLTVAEGVASIRLARKAVVKPLNETHFGITPKCKRGSKWNMERKSYRCIRNRK